MTKKTQLGIYSGLHNGSCLRLLLMLAQLCPLKTLDQGSYWINADKDLMEQFVKSNCPSLKFAQLLKKTCTQKENQIN